MFGTGTLARVGKVMAAWNMREGTEAARAGQAVDASGATRRLLGRYGLWGRMVRTLCDPAQYKALLDDDKFTGFDISPE